MAEAEPRSHSTISANKMAAERVVWSLWADSLVLAIPNNSGQSDLPLVTCLLKSRANPALHLETHPKFIGDFWQARDQAAI